MRPQRQLLMAGLALALAAPARAQRAIDVAVGAGVFRFNGQPNTTIIAGRVATPVGEMARLEVGLGLVPNDAANTISRDSAVFVLPELGLVLGPRGGVFHPYVTAGAAALVDVTHLSDGAVGLFAGLGVQVDVSTRWGVRIDGRAKSLGVYGTSRELTLAVTWKLSLPEPWP